MYKLLNRLKTSSLLSRDIGYVFWVFAEQAAYLAVPRLILFPLAAYIIGKEDFGVFSFAFSITLILGMQPQNGLATGLLRHLSEYDERQQTQFFGTALKMSHPVLLAIVGLGVIASLAAGIVNLAAWKLLNCLIPLTILLYPENQFLLILTETRYLRKFRERALWVSARAILAVVSGIAGAMIGGVIGLSWGFFLGNAVCYVLVRYKYKAWLKTEYDSEMAAVLKSVWLQITVAGILTVSIPHINRIILGAFHSYLVVADFMAATTVFFLFLAPTYCFGGLIMSILSKYSSANQLSRRGKIYFGCILFLGIVGIPVFMYIMGPLGLRLLFPAFGDNAVQLLKILVWVVPSEAFSTLTRPFIYKFAPVKLIPIINLMSFIVILVLGFLLIPMYGAVGAAWGYVIGNAFTAIIWSIIYFKLFVVKSQIKNSQIESEIQVAG